MSQSQVVAHARKVRLGEARSRDTWTRRTEKQAAVKGMPNSWALPGCTYTLIYCNLDKVAKKIFNFFIFHFLSYQQERPRKRITSKTHVLPPQRNLRSLVAKAKHPLPLPNSSNYPSQSFSIAIKILHPASTLRFGPGNDSSSAHRNPNLVEEAENLTTSLLSS